MSHRKTLRRDDGGRSSAHGLTPLFSPIFPLPLVLIVAIFSTVSGCGSVPKREPPGVERAPQISKAPAPAPRARRGGGYYLDDGPGDTPPPDLERILEPVPQLEPLHRGAMRPYVVLGQSYTPMTELAPYRARGVATWYGRRYHGKQTSNGEIYDMYAISAAHPTLPIPSYARVTNVTNGRSIVVRINDRGPFIDNRLIDLSYTAAHRLGVLGGGSAAVEVEAIISDEAPSGTLAAVAPRSTASIATAQAATAAAARGPGAPSGATPQKRDEVDPILAIATAAREADPPTTTPAAAQSPDAVAAPSPPRAAMHEGGVYLQLAAFGSRENAESFIARVKPQVQSISQILHLYSRDGMFRVHAGPYASSTEARQAAERIALTLGTRPVVVTR